jgi:hypothetical protein
MLFTAAGYAHGSVAFFIGEWYTNIGKMQILPTFFDQRFLIVITCLLVTPVSLYYLSRDRLQSDYMY